MPDEQAVKQKYDLFGGLVGGIIVDLARQIARGFIEGVCERYSVDKLKWHIDNDTDLITEAFRSPDPKDAAMMNKMKRLAERYKKHGPRIRQEVTADWLINWLRLRYPQHTALLETPRGKLWFQKNFSKMLGYFFPV